MSKLIPMKFLLLAAALLLGASLAGAQTTFPGLKAILTDAEWKRAGLDRLTPDEIGVVDAALIRHQAGATAHLQTELATVRETAVTATATATVERKQGFLQRFGLPTFDDADWRSLPPLKARVVKWESANRFKLDNGQVWEGFDPITYELVGKDIEIQARPHGQFALIVEGLNTTLRVMRLR
jgi:hypothetical protein